jgi:hypothetical protein
VAIPLYKLTTRSFVQADGTAAPFEYAIGATIFYSGIPSRTWIPLNSEATAALAALAASSMLPSGPTRAGKFDAWSGC